MLSWYRWTINLYATYHCDSGGNVDGVHVVAVDEGVVPAGALLQVPRVPQDCSNLEVLHVKEVL